MQVYALPRPFSQARAKHEGPLSSTVMTMLRGYRLPATAYRPPYIRVRTQAQYSHWFTICSRKATLPVGSHVTIVRRAPCWLATWDLSGIFIVAGTAARVWSSLLTSRNGTPQDMAQSDANYEKAFSVRGRQIMVGTALIP